MLYRFLTRTRNKVVLYWLFTGGSQLDLSPILPINNPLKFDLGESIIQKYPFWRTLHGRPKAGVRMVCNRCYIEFLTIISNKGIIYLLYLLCSMFNITFLHSLEGIKKSCKNLSKKGMSSPTFIPLRMMIGIWIK